MELVDERPFSFTLSGETLSLAAANATITAMKDEKVIEHLWAVGGRLRDGCNVLASEFGVEKYIECVGLAPRTALIYKGDARVESLAVEGLFRQECLKRGVLVSSAQNVCYSHSDVDIDYTLRVYRSVMEVLLETMREGGLAERIESPLVQSVFRYP